MKQRTFSRLFLRWGVPLVLLAVFLAFVVSINRVDKTPLVSREGQTFEKGVVTQILQDNLMPDGSRVGEQKVLVRMTTGVRAGEELETTSSSGYLFGAGCTQCVLYPLAEQARGGDACFIGLTDPSARKCVSADLLAFAAPYGRFLAMEANAGESFLHTETWEIISKRI